MRLLALIVPLQGLAWACCTNTTHNDKNLAENTFASFHLADYDSRFWTVEQPINRTSCCYEDHPWITIHYDEIDRLVEDRLAHWNKGPAPDGEKLRKRIFCELRCDHPHPQP